MSKILVLSLLLIQLVNAQKFDDFLQKAVANSPLLQASSIQVDQAYSKGELLLRYKNPNIEMETSSFDTNLGESTQGYRVSVTQPLRLWGVSNDKKTYSNALVKSAKASRSLKKARFVRDMSLAYLNYIQSEKFLHLSQSEIALAKKIYEISRERFRQGTISRGKLLQAKVDYELAQSRYENLSIVKYKKYTFLLKQAGIDEEVVLDTDHEFTLHDKQEYSLSPDQILLQSQSHTAMALSEVNDHKVEWINLFGEHESEPEQDIVRFGVRIPLAVFNTKSEEKRIAQLESKQNSLLFKVTQTRDNIERIRLQKEAQRLTKLKVHSNEILKTEKELLTMYEDGYKIANINLLELQNIKNQVIESQERLINIQTRIQSNIINQNYLEGSYNE
jgi:cobalt-zinc-cadmium efflux system outer membrane protein